MATDRPATGLTPARFPYVARRRALACRLVPTFENGVELQVTRSVGPLTGGDVRNFMQGNYSLIDHPGAKQERWRRNGSKQNTLDGGPLRIPS